MNPVIDRLEKQGYIARQSKSSRSWFLNLAGPKSVNTKLIKGLILINKEIIFGTLETSQIKHFINQVLEKKEGKLIKREDVAGDKRGRVTVELNREKPSNNIGKTTIFYKIGTNKFPIDGHISRINFTNNRYEWEEIENFLIRITPENIENHTGFTNRWLSADEGEAIHPNVNEAYLPQGDDRRQRVIRQILERRGQTLFRNNLRNRYGDRCLVTDCKVLDVLEAAHINPYRGEEDNHPENGLLLRSDIHTLFDLDLLGIEPAKLRVELHPDVSKEYGQLAGKILTCVKENRPSSEALHLRYENFKKRRNSAKQKSE